MKRIAFLLFSILIFSMAVFAQDLDDVTISGKVTDINNQAILGASVTATLVGKGTTRTVQTDDEGRYRLIELPPGTYTIKVSMQGFGAKERKDLATVSGQNVQINFQLTPGDVSATVDVTPDDATTTVDTTKTVVGGTITEREIEDIPNNSRNPLDLVLTLGGTSEEQLSTKDLAEDRNQAPPTAPLEQGNFTLSGGTAYSNNLTIDGFDNNDDRSSRERFQPSSEAISEVQVVKNQFSAEYGRASGGRINIALRSGSNKFRGRAFMFFRDDNLNANTWYNNSRGFARLPLTQYNPGFTFSGPVIIPFGEGKSIYDGHDRTFFSVAYEYDKILDTTFIDTYVPVVGNPRFTLPASTGGAQSCDNASATACTSTPPTAAFVAPYNALFDTPSTGHILTAKIDHRFNSVNDMTFGLQFGRKNNQRTTGTSTTRLDEALQARISDTEAYNFTDNHIFGANAVNQFRVQYSTFKPSFETADPLAPVVLIGYRNPITSGVQTLIAGNSTNPIPGDSTGFPQSRTETRWQFMDSMTYIKGDHTLKFGGDIQTIKSQANALQDQSGTFNFGSVLTYQQNVLSRYRQNFGTASDVNNTYYAAFLNDEIRLKSNLTLTLGLRYEKETVLGDNNNWGPRVGLAWDPFKQGKGVIRFGGGIFYNRTLLRTVADSIQNNTGQVPFDTNFIGTGATDPRRTPILAAIANQFPNTFPNETQLHNLVAQVCAPINTVSLPCNSNTGFSLNSGTVGNPLRSVDPSLKIPESYQFNAGFEREIAKGLVFEANYTYNRTIRLWRDRNVNAPILPNGFADWTAYLLANPFVYTVAGATVPTTRTYQFYLGATNDGTGVSSSQATQTACLTTGTITCFVNLNSVSTSTTAPSIAVPNSTTNATGSPIGIALAAIARFRPDPNFEEKSRIGSIGKAFYQGLVLELRSNYRSLGAGFRGSIRGAYTLSITKDDGLNNTSNAEVNGDFVREYARTTQDRRHRLAILGNLELPNWLGKLKFSPLFRFGSSAPFSLGNGGTDRNLDDLSTDRLNFSGNLSDIVWRQPGTPFPATLASQFSLAPIGAKSGNLPRNVGKGPIFYTLDISVSREFKRDRFRLRPVIEIGNVLNAAVFNYGAGFIDFSGLSSTASATTIANFQNSFLVPTRTYRQRQVRIGMRFDF